MVPTVEEINMLPPVEELSKAEGYALLDTQTRKQLGISAEEFLRKYDAGEYAAGIERTEIAWLEMLMPFAR